MDQQYYRSVRPDLPGRNPMAELAAHINARQEPLVSVSRQDRDPLIAAGADPARLATHRVGGPLPGEIWIEVAA